jgi:hypothetical protein
MDAPVMSKKTAERTEYVCVHVAADTDRVRWVTQVESDFIARALQCSGVTVVLSKDFFKLLVVSP